MNSYETGLAQTGLVWMNSDETGFFGSDISFVRTNDVKTLDQIFYTVWQLRAADSPVLC